MTGDDTGAPATAPFVTRGRRSRVACCPECRMRVDLCVCALVEPIATRTRVILILHQLEDSKPSNTGRLAVRCLTNSTTVRRGRTPADVVPDWLTSATNPVLLFPRPGARPISEWAGAGPVTLIVPDGTWRQASKTPKRIAGLGNLPCATLPPGPGSSYRLRHSPQAERLCTLEAIARALGQLEGPAAERHLEHILRVVVDRTLWAGGRMPATQVTGGLPEGALAAARTLSGG